MARHHKRTEVQQIEELNSFHMQAVHLIQWISTVAPGSPRDRRLHQKAKVLSEKIAERFRLDRCYYCGDTKNLVIEKHTGLCQCIPCAGDTRGQSLEQSTASRDRFNERN